MSHTWAKAREPISSFTHMLGAVFFYGGNIVAGLQDDCGIRLVVAGIGRSDFVWSLIDCFVFGQLHLSFL